MQTKSLYIIFIILIILIIFFNIIQFYAVNPSLTERPLLPTFAFSSNSAFSWPTPGFHNITSTFGTRVHPITKKESNHQGIDISASAGTDIYSVQSGIVILAKFNGANGYSIHISNGNLEFIYGHVSPNYIVSVGQQIEKDEIIGQVGPKYVEKTPENYYTDYTGNSTNGSTTGPHLHFSIKKDGIAVNPLDFF